MKDSISHASVDEILTLYGLYKQATVGDASTHARRPGLLDPKGRAKYDAWEYFVGTSPQLAMNAYVVKVQELRYAYEQSETDFRGIDSPNSQGSTSGP
jgi:diazepam-binding inhibitor (GABA receptor modulating acyl-CoA-binding protein)